MPTGYRGRARSFITLHGSPDEVKLMALRAILLLLNGRGEKNRTRWPMSILFSGVCWSGDCDWRTKLRQYFSGHCPVCDWDAWFDRYTLLKVSETSVRILHENTDKFACSSLSWLKTAEGSTKAMTRITACLVFSAAVPIVFKTTGGSKLRCLLPNRNVVRCRWDGMQVTCIDNACCVIMRSCHYGIHGGRVSWRVGSQRYLACKS